MNKDKKQEIIYPLNPVLVIDDEEAIVSGYMMALKRKGVNNVICLTDSREALKVVKSQQLDMVLLDLNMPFVTGEELLRHIVECQPGVPVLVVSGKDAVESAVECMKMGAYDYLVKPVPAERIVTSIRNALHVRELQRENMQLRDQFLSADLNHPGHFADIVTVDTVMKSVFLYIEAIAPTGNPVLLSGETGVGKELIARAIHKSSGRSGAFIAVNIAGLDDTMFSDTLFGHVRGAFTGANIDRQGLISQAEGGTLFLDEIGDLSAASQIKLLRLLQEQEYMPLGDDNYVKSDARVIVATNADLARFQESGRFRPDLYYRLSTHKIQIPPLRKRVCDIRPLVEFFVEAAAAKASKPKPKIPPELVTILSSHTFPGNVRELQSMVTDAVSRSKSQTLSLKSFRDHLSFPPSGNLNTAVQKAQSDMPAGLFGNALPPLKDIKRLIVEEALRRTGQNRTRAAELLQTSRQALSWHLQKHDN